MPKLKNDTISILSLDLETMGLMSNAAIVSVGIYHVASIKYDNTRIKVAEPSFYEVCNLKQQEMRGATIDSSTLDWWSKQPDEVREALVASQIADIDNTAVVGKFREYVKSLPGSPVWVVQGSDFDIPIIKNFLGLYAEKLPGFYRHKICLRTLLMTNPVGNVRNEMMHNALSDAKAQANRFSLISPQSKELLVKTLFTSAGY